MAKKVKEIKVEGSVAFAGDTEDSNKFNKILNSEAEFQAVGYIKIPDSREYISYVLTIKNGEIIKIQTGEPNLRAVVADETKLNFVNCFENTSNG